MNENKHSAITRTNEISTGAGTPAMGKSAGSIIAIDKNLDEENCGENLFAKRFSMQFSTY